MTETYDLYSVLSLNRNATQDNIKKAYKQKALQFHPDKNGGNDKQFKIINEAYQILSDPDKRKMYDLKYEDNINLDILNKFATILMNIVQEKLKDKLKQTSMNSQDKNTQSKQEVAPIKLNISVDLEDVYHAKVKKLLVKVRRKQDNDFILKAIPLYLSLLNYENSYIFKNQGDENNEGNRGDIIVNLKVNSENPTIDTLFCKYDLHMECDMTLYEYLYGIDRSIQHFDDVIKIQTEPILELVDNNDCIYTYTYEVSNYGLPYVQNIYVQHGNDNDDDNDDEVKRGKLYIHFKLKISKVPRDVLLEYKNIFKTYFNSEVNNG